MTAKLRNLAKRLEEENLFLRSGEATPADLRTSADRLDQLEELKEERVRCSSCGKSVSSPVFIRSELILRAYIECPECLLIASQFREQKEHEPNESD